MNKVILFDPSLHNNNGLNSTNLGDLVISKAVLSILSDLLPQHEILRISSKEYPTGRIKKLIKDSQLSIVGGTNILSSHISEYNQWEIRKNRFEYFLPLVQDVLLFGVGWWQYQDNIDLKTRIFYKRILNHRKMHSVRDAYTKEKLKSININNVINTSCPTTWNIERTNPNRQKSSKICVLSITDYYFDYESDNQFIEMLLLFFDKIIFFPQGKNDIECLKQLPSFKVNKAKFILLSHEIDELYNIFKDGYPYIGTRLHAGILSLQFGNDTLILAVDNRANEMMKDINIPVVGRAEMELIQKWIKNDFVFNKNIELPEGEIKMWKDQLRSIF